MKRAVLIFAAIALTLSGFVAGKLFAERQTQQLFATAHEHLSKLDQLAHYITSRDVSQSISAKQYEHASCVADVTASVYYRELQACLAEERCRSTIYEPVKKDAPELLSSDKRPFKYYDSGQRCVPR